MVTLTTVFWMFLLFFGVIGALRGWAKELLVAIAVVWAITLILTLERFMPIFPQLVPGKEKAYFIARMLVFLPLVFFGYHVPRTGRFEPRTRRENVRDMVLGFVFGLVNGFLIMSTVWYYLDQANYPLGYVLSPAQAADLFHADPEVQNRLAVMLENLYDGQEIILRWALPNVIGWPWIYFLTLAMGVLLIVVFL